MAPIENIFIIRHGESQEDIRPEIKGLFDDSEIALTEKGIQDCKDLALKIKGDLERYEHITLYVSPYKRTMQTAEILIREFTGLSVEMRVETSLRSLNWGNINPDNLRKIEQERYKVGALYYHFPGGDSSTEYVKNIYDFVLDIIEQKHVNSSKDECIIIIAHGFSCRIVVKAFTSMSDEDFKWIKNPSNTSVSRIYFDPIVQAFIIEAPLQKYIQP
jgi:broad specificity phosphatase PhoE